jgi:hypothetical protein
MARSKRLNQEYIDFSGGLQTFTSPLLLKEEETPLCYNVNIRQPGILGKANGYAQLGSGTASGTNRGVFSWDREDGTTELYHVYDDDLYYYSGTASGWTTVGTALGATGSAPVEWATHFVNTGTGVGSGADTFVERLYISQGKDQGVIKFTTGSSISGVVDVYAKHLATYKGRLYAGNVKQGSNDHPIRVIYSDVSGESFADDNFIDDMGEPIMALKEYSGALFIFTENKVAYYDEYKLTPINTNGGVVNAETVQIAEGKLLWYNRGGVHMYAGGTESILISRPIVEWLDEVSDATEVTAGLDIKGRYCLYVGDVTVNSVAYSDVVIRYDVLINAWDILTDRPFKYWTRNKAGGVYELYTTNPDGQEVWQADFGTALDGGAQASYYETPLLYGSPENADDYKNAYRVEVTYKPTNESEYITVKYRTDGTGSWKAVGGTANNIPLTGTDEIKTYELVLPKNVRGKFLQLQFTHSSAADGFRIYNINLKYDIEKFDG